MEMSREVIESFQFRESRKGYDMREVDEFLEKLAVAFAQVQDRLREAEQRAEAAQARVADAQRRATEAEQRAAEVEGQPRAASESSESDETETLRRTLVLAQRTADAAIKEAEEHANRIRGEAEEMAARLRGEAESEARGAAEATRQEALQELRDLEVVRTSLQDDIQLLEAHVGEHRDQLRTAVNELQRALDDPASLQMRPEPVLSGATVPVEEAPALEATEPPPEATWEPDAFVDPLVDAEAPAEPESFEPLTFEDPPVADAEPAPAAAEPSAAWMPDDSWDELAVEPAAVVAGDDPPTEAIDALATRDAGDDEYLAELRKAMTDDSPLGPREDDDDDSGGFFDQGADRPARTRFGRRR
jgi:DivIVA domain-containing protein